MLKCGGPAFDRALELQSTCVDRQPVLAREYVEMMCSDPSGLIKDLLQTLALAHYAQVMEGLEFDGVLGIDARGREWFSERLSALGGDAYDVSNRVAAERKAASDASCAD